MSLRLRILLLVLVASLLPVLLMLWLLLQQRSATLEQAREQLKVRTETIASDLDDKIAGTAQLLFGLGRVPVVNSNDKQVCSKFLAQVLKEHPQYTGILTIRSDGKLHCDSLLMGRQLQLSDRNYFRQARTATGVIVEPVIGRLTGKSVLQIAYPVRTEQGALKFILLASLDLDAYGNRALAKQAHQQMAFHLWNHDGSFSMVHPREETADAGFTDDLRSFMLSAESSGTEALGAGTQTRIVARAALPRSSNADMRLALSVAEHDLNAQADVQFRRAMTGLLASVVFIIAAAVLLGEVALRRQAIRLMQAISRMDAGDYSQPLGQPYPRGELGMVMQALDRMAISLDHQRTEIARNTEALERQARIDPLTHLANRHMLTERLWQALDFARRNHRITGVLILDLDRFKTVNDSLGHSQGDVLLREVASRLTASVREDDTVARLGGDEFVVVLSDMADVSDILAVAQKILFALSRPVELGPQMLSISTSLGIAVYPKDGETPDALLQYADTAMYRAKDQGGNALAFFSPEMRQVMMERLAMEAGLRQALEQGELRLHYQPIVEAGSGRVIAAEALVRWAHPKNGLISPADFIPVAEETGLITHIGSWVLHEASRQARQWQKEGLGDIPVAVNLSARQFSEPGLDLVVARALEASQCPASLLYLEITESSIMDQIDQAMETMRKLNTMGIQLAIDDFGTGYSSLSQLKRLPVSTLKIDRSFVLDLCQDANDEVLVDAIITLAHKLGLRTVAEGVETAEQLTFLEQRGCDSYQGYLFSRPCDAIEFARYVRSQRPRT